MYAKILKLDQPKKKKKYKYVVKMPAEKILGWQEVNMDIGKINESLDSARQAIFKSLKYDSSQPRDEKGQWKKIGYALNRLVEQFGADWMKALEVIQHEGAMPDLLEGTLDLFRLAKTPALRGIIKKRGQHTNS